MALEKPQQYVFHQGMISRDAMDLWQGCVLAYPFWDYKLRILEDLSGNGLHAVFNTNLDPISDWDVSTYGSYLDTEGGANEEATVDPPPGAWLDGTSRMSWEIIFRCDAAVAGSGTLQGLIGKYTTTNGRRSWRIYVNGDEVALQVSSDGTGNEIQETTNCNLGTSVWAHVVLTYNAGVFKAYKDGVALTTDGDFGTHLSIFAGTIEPLRIFARSDSNRLAGGMAGVRIWRDRVLSPDTVRRLYEDPWEMYRPVWPLPFMQSFATVHTGGAAAGPWIKAADVAKGFQAYQITGLNNGTSYDVKLHAVDQSGNASTGTTPVAGTPAVGAVATALRSRLTPRRAKSSPPPALLAKIGRP